MALRWRKVQDCPSVPGCDCPEPSSPPSYVGQQATTPCGGSSSSGSSSGGPSSNGSGSSGSSSSGAGSSGLPWYWVKGYEGCTTCYGGDCWCSDADGPNQPPNYNGEIVGIPCEDHTNGGYCPETVDPGDNCSACWWQGVIP